MTSSTTWVTATGTTSAISSPTTRATPTKTTAIAAPRLSLCRSSQRTTGSNAIATKSATPMVTSTEARVLSAPAKAKAISPPTVAAKPIDSGRAR